MDSQENTLNQGNLESEKQVVNAEQATSSEAEMVREETPSDKAASEVAEAQVENACASNEEVETD